MRLITEYLSTKVVNPIIIKATDKTIYKIVKDELDRLGHDADLNHIDVSKVTNMRGLFSCYAGDLGREYKDLNPDITKWDVSKVEDMGSMFWKCEKFNQDLSGWNVSNVESMESMFYKCKNFNQDLSSWNVSKVEEYREMFYECPIEEEFKPKFK